MNSRKLTKLDCPRFNGDDVEGWKYRCEQFFLIDETPANRKVWYAAIKFDGKALHWYQLYRQISGKELMDMRWDDFSRSTLLHFGGRPEMTDATYISSLQFQETLKSLQIAIAEVEADVARLKESFDAMEVELSECKDTPELEGIHSDSSYSLCCDYNNLVDFVDKNEVNSEKGTSAYKVFDEIPERIHNEIRTGSEAQFSDIYICETILSERTAQKTAILEVNEYKNDTIIIVNHDVIVEMDASSNPVLRRFKDEFGGLSPVVLIKVSHGEDREVMDFQSFGDIMCSGDFWEQKSLKTGVLDITSFGWKPGWLYTFTNIRNITCLKNGVDLFSYEFVTLLKDGMNLFSYEFLACQGNSRRIWSLKPFCAIESFGCKPGWILVNRTMDRELLVINTKKRWLLCFISIFVGPLEWKPGWNSVDEQLDVETNGVENEVKDIKEYVCLENGSIVNVNVVMESNDVSNKVQAGFVSSSVMMNLLKKYLMDESGEMELLAGWILFHRSIFLMRLQPRNPQVAALTVSGHTNSCKLITWNTVLAKYVQTGNFNEVFGLFADMKDKKDEVVVISVLSVCAQPPMVLETGASIHGLILENNGLVTAAEWALMFFGSAPLEVYCAHLLLSKDEVYLTMLDNKGSCAVYGPRTTVQIQEMKRKLFDKEVADKEFLQLIKSVKARPPWDKLFKGSWQVDERNWHKIKFLEAFTIDACEGDGRKNTVGVILKFNICINYPDHILSVGDILMQESPDLDKNEREDMSHMTHLKVYAMDVDEAHEFDDALSAAKLQDGRIKVWIHVTDSVGCLYQFDKRVLLFIPMVCMKSTINLVYARVSDDQISRLRIYWEVAALDERSRSRKIDKDRVSADNIDEEVDLDTYISENLMEESTVDAQDNQCQMSKQPVHDATQRKSNQQLKVEVVTPGGASGLVWISFAVEVQCVNDTTTTGMGFGIMDVLQCLASVGITKLSVMPLENISEKIIEQIPWVSTPSLEGPHQQDSLQQIARSSQCTIFWPRSSKSDLGAGSEFHF